MGSGLGLGVEVCGLRVSARAWALLFDEVEARLFRYPRRLVGRVQLPRESLTRFYGLLPEHQGQNLALTALYVPYSLDTKAANNRRSTLTAGPAHPAL